MIHIHLRSLLEWLAEMLTGLPTRHCEYGCEFSSRCGSEHVQHVEANHAGDSLPEASAQR